MAKRTGWLLFLLLVLTRATLVLSVADVFYYGDELSKAGGSKALLDGMGVPAWRLTYVYHEGGGFLLMYLRALVFRLIGPNLLALKVTAILTTSAALAAGLALAAEHFGRRAAAIFGLLFVFAPDAYLRASMIAVGTHFESAIPIALVFHYGLRVLFSDRARPRDWALLGAWAGLGLYVSLQTAPATAVVAVAILLRRRGRVPVRGVAAAVVGFAVGAIPLWIMMGHVGLAAVLVQGHANFSSGPTGWDALLEITRPLREFDVVAWVETLAFVCGIGMGLARARGRTGDDLRARAAPILAYLAVFGLVLLQSGFLFENRGHWIFWLRCSPFWFLATLLFAACTDRLLETARGGSREMALAATAFLLVFGAAAFGALASHAHPGNLAGRWRLLVHTKGYDLPAYFDKLANHLEGSIADRFAVLLRFPDEPSVVCPSAAHALFEKAGMPLPRAVEITRASCGPEWAEGLVGLGLAAAPDYGHDVRAAFERIESQPPEERAALAEGLGRVALGILVLPEKIGVQARLRVPEELREPFLRGAGWRVRRLHPLRKDLAIELIARQPPDAIGPILAGYVEACEETEIK